jgi:hypothetical protein
MKKYYFVITLVSILFICVRDARGAKPRFFIRTSTITNSEPTLAENAFLQYFEAQIIELLKKTYPCVEITTRSGFLAAIENERKKELLGVSGDNALERLGEALGCDYLISLKAAVQNGKLSISAICIYVKKEMALSRVIKIAADGDAGLDAVEASAKELIDGLKKYEICPFTGQVNVRVESKVQTEEKEENPVNCKGKEGIFKRVTSVYKTSDNNWNLIKEDKYSASGSVQFKMYEEMKIEEQNDCYPGPNGNYGGRTSYERTVGSADIKGLSKESEIYGVKVDDARAELLFLDDGTYTLKVKAASKQGDMQEKKEEHAEGSYDNIPPRTTTKNKKADVSVFKILGPFKGDAQEKSLVQKGTVKEVDEETKEERTITFEFKLTRD